MFKSFMFYMAFGLVFIGLGVSSLSQANNGLAGAQLHLLGGLLETIAGIGFISIGIYRKVKGQTK